jgi:LuxR family quorum-sensing system transcriptional regulator SolR
VSSNLDADALDRSALVHWFSALAEFQVRALVVLGPDPYGVRACRQLVSVYPADFNQEAAILARSPAFGAAWRATLAPLAAWKNLAAGPGEPDGWVSPWIRRGVLSMVRVDFPTAFDQGFESFMFCGRQFADGEEAKRIAYSALSAWPLVKAEVVARRYSISPRELEVLVALAAGLTAKETADRIGCAERTVGYHQSHLMQKLGAGNRAAVVQRACSLGLL